MRALIVVLLWIISCDLFGQTCYPGYGLSGPADICPGNQYNYVADFYQQTYWGSSIWYSWDVSGGYLVSNNQNNATIQWVGSSGDVTVTVYEQYLEPDIYPPTPTTLCYTGTISVYQSLSAYATPASATTLCQGGNVVLMANTGSGYSYQWFRDNVAISGATSSNYTATLAGSYTVTITKSPCSATSSPVPVTVVANPPVPTATGAVTAMVPEGTVLTASGGTSYQWRLDGSPIPGATSSQWITTRPGTYTVANTVGGCASVSSAVSVGSGNVNHFVVSNSILVPNLTSESQVYGQVLSSGNIGYVSQGITYMDDLGREAQTIGRQALPQKVDAVEPKKYDNLARETESFPVMGTSQNSGLLVANPVGTTSYVGSPHYNFYTSTAGVPAETKAYTDVKFDDSPLNRVVQQGGLGVGYQPGEPGDTDITYTSNQASDIRIYTIASDLPVSTSTFAVGLLGITRANDPQGVVSEQVTHRDGRTIVQRSRFDAANWAETYNVYDEYDRLRFILPPELMRKLRQSGNFNPTQAQVDAYAYQFRYDNLGRKVETKVPGVGWSFYVYDSRDRLVLSQSPKQRVANEWSYTKYDELNRPVISGIYRPGTAISRASMQTTIDNLSGGAGQQSIGLLPVPAGAQTGTDIVLSAYQGHNTYIASNSITLQPGFNYAGGSGTFTAAIHPQLQPAEVFPQTNDEALVVTYYDKYTSCPPCQDPAFQFVNESWGIMSNEPFQKFDRVNNLTVATSVKVLGTTNQWLHSVNYYNRKLQPLQVISGDHLGGRQRFSKLTDFGGLTLATLTTYQGSTTSVSTILRQFDYDHSGRVIRTWHQINNQPKVILSESQFNALGQVIDEKLHSVNGEPFLQSVDYQFNSRGSLTQINSTTGDAGDTAPDYFRMELAYDQPISGLSTARMDGLVSGMKWKAHLETDRESGYSFGYNNLGWLTNSDFKFFNAGSWNNQTGFYSEDGIQYDYNGNIRQLSRKQRTSAVSAPVIDQLLYDYGSAPEGNLLQAVTDNAPAGDKAKGFNDGNTTGVDYVYDENGNLKEDKNKGIASIVYFFNNRPERVNFSNGTYLKYIYDANGEKLQQALYNAANQVQSKLDYVGELVLMNDQLLLVKHERGRALPADNQNLISSPTTREANSTEGFTALGSCTLASEFVSGSGQTYVKATSSAAGSYGMQTIGGSSVAVKAGQKYTYKILGYQSAGNAAQLVAIGSPGNVQIVTGPSLPVGAANENWVTASFTIPSNITSVDLRVVVSSGASGNIFYVNRVALYKDDFDYQYYLTDQIGSPRVVLSTTLATLTFAATMEAENYSTENTQWLNLNYAYREVNGAANATPGGNEVLRMNNQHRVGPSKSFKVLPGDVINATVQAYYPSASGLTQATATVMTSAVQAVLSGGSPVVDGAISSVYGNTTNYPLFAPSQGSTRPSAFINYILFDDFYQVLEAKSTPVGATANVRHAVNLPTVNVKLPGYLFVYLSYDNESTASVYFDEFKITYTESPVVQINQNYPYGMTAISWLREGENENKYLYQGKEFVSETGWHDFHARQYDATLGRWFAVDPQDQFASPFNAMGNNPILAVDPDGEFVHILIGAAIGGLINLGIKAAQGKITSWKDGFVAFGIGAAAGAVGAATGGVAFLATGGGALGAGGFLAGAAGGITGSIFSLPIQSIGNSLYFGDPLMTAKEFVTGALFGGVLGGTFQGVSALRNGREFWKGGFGKPQFIPANSNTTPEPLPKPKMTDDPEVQLSQATPEKAPVVHTQSQPNASLDDLSGLPATKPDNVRISLANEVDVKLLGTARDNLLNSAKDPKLRNIVNDLFRPDAQIGNGSAMDAYKFQKLNGALVGGKSHGTKLIIYRNALEKLWGSTTLNSSDRQIVKYLLTEIQNALSN